MNAHVIIYYIIVIFVITRSSAVRTHNILYIILWKYEIWIILLLILLLFFLLIYISRRSTTYIIHTNILYTYKYYIFMYNIPGDPFITKIDVYFKNFKKIYFFLLSYLSRYFFIFTFFGDGIHFNFLFQSKISF